MANLTSTDVNLTVESGSAAEASDVNFNSYVYDVDHEVTADTVVVKEVVIWITNEIEKEIDLEWKAVTADATHKKVEYGPAPANQATHIFQNGNFVPATAGATHKKLDKAIYERATQGATHKSNAKQTPDIGYDNGIEEYETGGKYYSKKNLAPAAASKTTFPIYKAYIYKADGVGQAKAKLEQDVQNGNKNQAEAEFLYFARHSGGVAHANKTYFRTGSCLPPTGLHGQPDYYQLMFKQGGSGDRLSYRYRIVLPEAIQQSNLPRTTGTAPNTQDISTANEHLHGDMIFLKQRQIELGETTITSNQRDASSFDPWKSKDMRGCQGVKTSTGDYVNSANTYTLYKNKYHAVNTYVEEKIPELKGIYGRRDFSDNTDSTDAKIKLEEPTDITVEYKAFIKVEPLLDVDNILGI